MVDISAKLSLHYAGISTLGYNNGVESNFLSPVM